MRQHGIIQTFSVIGLVAVCAAYLPVGASASAATGGQDRVTTPPDDGGSTVSAAPPAGAQLDARVIELESEAQLLAAVNGNDGVYIHIRRDRTWYFKSAGYLLGIEAFTRYHKRVEGIWKGWNDIWVELGTGDHAAPSKARVVGDNLRGHGWRIPPIAEHGRWPASINSVWVIGTESDAPGTFGMGGAPQAIPLGTEVFDSMQTYGGQGSVGKLQGDKSPREDAKRIREMFRFNPTTLLGGYSAGASVARRIALDLGLTHVWLYGTPNYSRQNGAYTHTETGPSGHKMTAEVINNNNDPVTNCLERPTNLAGVVFGASRCHDYSGWDYQARTPVTVVCR